MGLIKLWKKLTYRDDDQGDLARYEMIERIAGQNTQWHDQRAVIDGYTPTPPQVIRYRDS